MRAFGAVGLRSGDGTHFAESHSASSRESRVVRSIRVMCRLMRTVKDVALVGRLCFTAGAVMWGRESSPLMTGAVTPYTVAARRLADLDGRSLRRRSIGVG